MLDIHQESSDYVVKENRKPSDTFLAALPIISDVYLKTLSWEGPDYGSSVH